MSASVKQLKHLNRLAILWKGSTHTEGTKIKIGEAQRKAHINPSLKMKEAFKNGRVLCQGCHKKTISFARNKPLEFCRQCPHCKKTTSA